MNLTITARHFKAKDSLKELIHEKIEKLTRFQDDIIDCEVIMSEEHESHIAEIKLHLNHKVIVVTEKSENMYKSIELISDRLERQLRRQREKKRDFRHNRIADQIVEPAPSVDEFEDYE
jgi:putative sigma-54 modulation protein